VARARRETSPSNAGAVQPTVPAAKVRVRKISALPRQRLTALLPDLRKHGLGLVVAPAGSGKTTFAAQIAAAADGPVAWYAAEQSDGDEKVFLTRLEHAFALAIPELGGSWKSVEAAAATLEGLEQQRKPALLVVDDFHLLQGSPAEAAFERLLEYAPAELTVLIASRTRPAFNLSRLRVSGSLLELGPDDLRFRSWEVERLFNQFYGDPLPPEELALLTRRTEGWAAGLQLFHLATRDKAPSERRRTLAALRARWKLVREYLASNVLHELDPDLREFLVRTSVLTLLSGRLCDELLGRTGSEEVLEQLEEQQIFTVSLDDQGHYRYHEVLRAQLEATYVESAGAEEAREHYRKAGRLLEDDGALPDALRAYSRAEDRDAVARLLGRGEELAEGGTGWIDLLPDALVRHDPWLQLARAREDRVAGRLARAIAGYEEAERGFGRAAAAELCRRERLAVAAWIEPAFVPTSDWLGVLRGATIRDPAAVRRKATRLGGPGGRLAGGLSALVAGQLSDAIDLLAGAEQDPEASPPLAAAAHVGSAVALLLCGDEVKGAVEADLAAEESERIGLSALARIGRAALALSDRPDGRAEAASAAAAAAREEDAWGAALASFLEGWGALRAGERVGDAFDRAIDEFHALGASALEAWARAGKALALARINSRNAEEEALAAESAARTSVTRAPLAAAYLALSELGVNGAAEYRALARSTAEETGLAVPGYDPSSEPETEPSLVVRCFGGFSIATEEGTVDLGALKPRARQVLRMLAMNAGRALHREVLIEAFWPDADRDTGTRNLHVAISSIRHALEPGVARGASSMVVRDGDAYRLALPAGSRVDLIEFDAALAEARALRARGDLDAALGAYNRALDLYTGELLPEDGPADWVVHERERRRDEASESAHAVAEMHLERGDPVAAAVACERGLHADQYDDALWRLCISAYEKAGDAAAAARAKQKYDRILAGLGVSLPDDVSVL
jgi:DNA-binding SARP family transcriptional activator